MRDSEGHVGAIVEHKDATGEQRRITLVNTGIIAAEATALKRWLASLSAENAQGEYYLTDVFAMAAGEYSAAELVMVDDPLEAEELVLDVIDPTLGLGAGEQARHGGGLEGVAEVALVSPALLGGEGDEPDGPVADLAAEEALGQGPLGGGLTRGVGQGPAQRGVAVDDRRDREQVLGQARAVDTTGQGGVEGLLHRGGGAARRSTHQAS